MQRTAQTEDKLPKTIGIKTREMAPLLTRWEKDNPGVPWSELLRRGLKKELSKYAGKKLAHLVEA